LNYGTRIAREKKGPRVHGFQGSRGREDGVKVPRVQGEK